MLSPNLSDINLLLFYPSAPWSPTLPSSFCWANTLNMSQPHMVPIMTTGGHLVSDLCPGKPVTTPPLPTHPLGSDQLTCDTGPLKTVAKPRPVPCLGFRRACWCQRDSFSDVWLITSVERRGIKSRAALTSTSGAGWRMWFSERRPVRIDNEGAVFPWIVVISEWTRIVLHKQRTITDLKHIALPPTKHSVQHSSTSYSLN